MNLINITIRAAAQSDTGDHVNCIYSSAAEMYNFIFEDKALDFINFEFKQGTGFTGYQNMTCAVADEQIIATGAFYDGKQHAQLLQESISNITAFFPKHQHDEIFTRSMATSNISIPEQDELYLGYFGVSNALRGKDIGTAMIKQRLNLARQQGYKKFSLDVANNNPKAENLYSKLGLNVSKHLSFDRTTGIPNGKKMEMLL